MSSLRRETDFYKSVLSGRYSNRREILRSRVTGAEAPQSNGASVHQQSRSGELAAYMKARRSASPIRKGDSMMVPKDVPVTPLKNDRLLTQSLSEAARGVIGCILRESETAMVASTLMARHELLLEEDLCRVVDAYEAVDEHRRGVIYFEDVRRLCALLNVTFDSRILTANDQRTHQDRRVLSRSPSATRWDAAKEGAGTLVSQASSPRRATTKVEGTTDGNGDPKAPHTTSVAVRRKDSSSDDDMLREVESIEGSESSNCFSDSGNSKARSSGDNNRNTAVIRSPSIRFDSAGVDGAASVGSGFRRPSLLGGTHRAVTSRTASQAAKLSQRANAALAALYEKAQECVTFFSFLQSMFPACHEGQIIRQLMLSRPSAIPLLYTNAYAASLALQTGLVGLPDEAAARARQQEVDLGVTTSATAALSVQGVDPPKWILDLAAEIMRAPRTDGDASGRSRSFRQPKFSAVRVGVEEPPRWPQEGAALVSDTFDAPHIPVGQVIVTLCHNGVPPGTVRTHSQRGERVSTTVQGAVMRNPLRLDEVTVRRLCVDSCQEMHARRVQDTQSFQRYISLKELLTYCGLRPATVQALCAMQLQSEPNDGAASTTVGLSPRLTFLSMKALMLDWHRIGDATLACIDRLYAGQSAEATAEASSPTLRRSRSSFLGRRRSSLRSFTRAASSLASTLSRPTQNQPTTVINVSAPNEGDGPLATSLNSRAVTSPNQLAFVTTKRVSSIRISLLEEGGSPIDAPLLLSPSYNQSSPLNGQSRLRPSPKAASAPRSLPPAFYEKERLLQLVAVLQRYGPGTALRLEWDATDVYGGPPTFPRDVPNILLSSGRGVSEVIDHHRISPLSDEGLSPETLLCLEAAVPIGQVHTTGRAERRPAIAVDNAMLVSVRQLCFMLLPLFHPARYSTQRREPVNYLRSPAEALMVSFVHPLQALAALCAGDVASPQPRPSPAAHLSIRAYPPEVGDAIRGLVRRMRRVGGDSPQSLSPTHSGAGGFRALAGDARSLADVARSASLVAMGGGSSISVEQSDVLKMLRVHTPVGRPTPGLHLVLGIAHQYQEADAERRSRFETHDSAANLFHRRQRLLAQQRRQQRPGFGKCDEEAYAEVFGSLSTTHPQGGTPARPVIESNPKEAALDSESGRHTAGVPSSLTGGSEDDDERNREGCPSSSVEAGSTSDSSHEGGAKGDGRLMLGDYFLGDHPVEKHAAQEETTQQSVDALFGGPAVSSVDYSRSNPFPFGAQHEPDGGLQTSAANNHRQPAAHASRGAAPIGGGGERQLPLTSKERHTRAAIKAAQRAIGTNYIPFTDYLSLTGLIDRFHVTSGPSRDSTVVSLNPAPPSAPRPQTAVPVRPPEVPSYRRPLSASTGRRASCTPYKEEGKGEDTSSFGRERDGAPPLYHALLEEAVRSSCFSRNGHIVPNARQKTIRGLLSTGKGGRLATASAIPSRTDSLGEPIGNGKASAVSAFRSSQKRRSFEREVNERRWHEIGPGSECGSLRGVSPIIPGSCCVGGEEAAVSSTALRSNVHVALFPTSEEVGCAVGHNLLSRNVGLFEESSESDEEGPTSMRQDRQRAGNAISRRPKLNKFAVKDGEQMKRDHHPTALRPQYPQGAANATSTLANSSRSSGVAPLGVRPHQPPPTPPPSRQGRFHTHFYRRAHGRYDQRAAPYPKQVNANSPDSDEGECVQL